MANFKNYPTFDDVEDRALRAYNRCVTAANINADSGEALTEKYMGSFDKADKVEMMGMFALISKRGVDEVKRMITKGEAEVVSVH